MIRVLVVDDSAFVRRRLAEILEGDRGLEVVGAAADGVEALEKVRRLRPDVVTLDVMMPRLDGLRVLAFLMNEERPPRVVMLSSLTHEGAEVTLQALDLGAVDYVDKTSLVTPAEIARLGAELGLKIRAAAAADPARLRRPAAPAGGSAGPRVGARDAPVDAVVIGASTGGPPALQRLIPALPRDCRAGVIVVQHMSPGFTRSFARRLDAAAALAVREAAEGDLVSPGVVLVAPGAVHLKFFRRGTDAVVVLDPEPADSLHRPSVDVTMQSAADTWGPRAAGVLLTGMGSDGAWGLRAMRTRGGHTIAESEESCVVYGMPKAAVELDAAEEVLPLERIAGRLADLTAGTAAGPP